MTRRLVIYAICSNYKELNHVASFLPHIDTHFSQHFILLNNTGLPFKVEDYWRPRVLMLFTDICLPLNQCISHIYYHAISDYYIRIDPDDFSYNVNSLWSKLCDLPKFDLLSCSYTLQICGLHGSTVLSSQYVGSIYEPLGAGIVVSRRLLCQSLKLSKGLVGQDNYAIWLSLPLLKNGVFLPGTHDYIYRLDNTDSMSSKTSRILTEKSILLSRLSKHNSFLCICLVKNKSQSSFEPDPLHAINFLLKRFFKLSLHCSIVFSNGLPFRVHFCYVRRLYPMVSITPAELLLLVVHLRCYYLVLTRFKRSLSINDRIVRLLKLRVALRLGARVVGF